MIHTNRLATDYEMGFSLASGLPTSNPQFGTGTSLFGLTETWGNGFVSGSMGMSISVINTQASPNTYEITAVTPWFSYDSGVITGWVASGDYFFLMQGARLALNSDCTWTLSFSGLQFWGSTNGSGSTLLASCGAQTMTGASYDERLNCTALSPSMERNTLPPTLSCTSPLTVSGAWSNGCSMAGGYRYKVSGSWFADPVTFDSSAPSASCTCSASLPGLTGSDSWSVGVGVSIKGSVALGSSSVPCSPTGCSATEQVYTTQTTTFTAWETAATVKGRVPNLRSQTVALTWDCLLNGVATSGSSTTTSSTSETSCASTRGVTVANHFLACAVHPIVGCSPPSFCASGPASEDCVYDGSSTLTWPSSPPCLPAMTALGYDVANCLRHCVAAASSTGIVLGTADNLLPQTWGYVSTGLSGTWARPRFQDLGYDWPIGLFYGDGSSCFFAQTYDEGNSWGSPISMASGTVGDFEEGRDGLRWFFKVISSDGGVTFDVWNRLMDAQLGVVRDWTITNVTGVDDAPIACRESAGFDGSWRIGLWYSMGGVMVVGFSPDGLGFS